MKTWNKIVFFQWIAISLKESMISIKIIQFDSINKLNSGQIKTLELWIKNDWNPPILKKKLNLA